MEWQVTNSSEGTHSTASVFVINWEQQDCHKHENTFLMHTYFVPKTSEIPVT